MSETDIQDMLGALTLKQREVLDLLIAHKTSKEIARDLGISPHTVDQRIQFAKSKLGAETRGECAVVYRRLLEQSGELVPAAEPEVGISDSPAYEESRSAPPAVPPDEGGTRDGDEPAPLIAPERSEPGKRTGQGAGYSVVPEMFEGRYGTSMRVGAVVLVTVMLLLIALGGVAIFDQLSRILAG